MNGRPTILNQLIFGNAVIGTIAFSLTAVTALAMIASTITGNNSYYVENVHYVLGFAVSNLSMLLLSGVLIWIALLFAKSNSSATKIMGRWLVMQNLFIATQIIAFSLYVVDNILDFDVGKGPGLFAGGIESFLEGYSGKAFCFSFFAVIYGNIAIRWAKNEEITAFLERAQWDGAED